MSAALAALHATAVAVATELVLGDADWRLIEALVEPLPDEAAPALITLIQLYGDNARVYGPASLHEAGLHAACLALDADQ